MIRYTLTVLGCAAIAMPTFNTAAQPAALYQSTSYKGREIGNLTGMSISRASTTTCLRSW